MHALTGRAPCAIISGHRIPSRYGQLAGPRSFTGNTLAKSTYCWSASVGHMDLYTFCLVLGGAGLATMGLLSLGHHAGHGHHGRAASHSHSHHHHGHARAKVSVQGAHGKWSRAALSILSPRTLFSLLLGVGLVGRVAESRLAGVPLVLTAVAGGILFELLLVGPLWNFLLRFASKPALTLESVVTDHATAVTAFDRDGRGLVAVELDGQVVQLLGTLQSADQKAGIRIRAGDRVRIDEVDAARNRCFVSIP